MKNYLTSFLIIGILFCSAQNNDNYYQPKKNIIKTNLTSLAFRNYQLTYERSLAKWFSIAATYHLTPEGKIPLLDRFVEDGDLDEIEDIDAIKLKGNAITVETRFYMGKGYGKGFYLSPYYRYSTYELNDLTVNYPMSIEGIADYDVPLDVSGDVKSHNLGLVMGVQWTIGRSESVVMDFWFLGGHYGMAKGDLAGVSSRLLTPQEQAQIDMDISDYDIPIIEYSYEVNENGASAKVDGPWAGLRGGFSIGFRF